MPQNWHSSIQRGFFAFLMLCSGLAGISYEILYGRILGNLIGDQFAVSAAVLITFLLGIGLGSIYAYRLWRWLWLIEFGIGVCGALFALGTSVLNDMLYASSALLPAGLAGSVFICIILLLVPAFLIGCSVPLFAGYLSRLAPTAGFSVVYAVYNIGAAITALAIEFALIRWLGIQGAMLVFVAINLFIAALLLGGFSNIAQTYPHKNDSTKYSDWLHVSRWQLSALVLASVASAIFQLYMIKMAELLFGPFRELFALVLAIVLIGIALGSALVRFAKLSFVTALLLAIFGLLISISAVDILMYCYAALYDIAAKSYIGIVVLKGFLLFVLMGLPAIGFGATVPALLSQQKQVARASGFLLFVASLANVLGFLLMAFLLHRYLDYGVQVLVVLALVVLALSVYWWETWRAEYNSLLQKAVKIAFICLLLLSAVSLHARYWDEDLLYLSYTAFHSLEDFASDKETFDFPDRFKGYQDVFSINWMDGDPYFFINGYISIPLNSSSELVVGTLASLFSPASDEAMVLGLGSGATASAVGQMFDHTDVVEINPVVRANLYRMKQWNLGIESNAGVNIIVDDGIHYAKAVDKKYAMILNTVTTPLYFSSSKLYTTDFLDIMHQRLRSNGIYVTWMDSRIGEVGADIILKSLQQSFKHCALFYIKGSYFLLIASDTPIHLQQLARLQGAGVLTDYLMNEHNILPQWLPYQLLTSNAYDLIGDNNAPINRMNNPTLEFVMARLHSSGFSDFKDRLLDKMSFDEVRQALDPYSFSATEMAVFTKKRLGNSSFTRRWVQQGRINIKNFDSQYAKKRVNYEELLVKHTNSGDAYHNLGYRLMKHGDCKEAIKAYQQALVRTPQHNNTNFNIASCYERLKELDKALLYYKAEAKVDSDDSDVSYRIGRLHIRAKRFAEGVSYLEQAIALESSA
ncbi:MAG: tetratricopeptide repeat protein, partial [Mariprofundales bacterium]